VDHTAQTDIQRQPVIGDSCDSQFSTRQSSEHEVSINQYTLFLKHYSPNLKGTEMTEANDTRNWPDLAIGLYDKLTGRNAEICYEFDQMEVSIPSAATENPAHALWKLNGKVKIRTSDGNKE
tara:strand:- start:421 stop:786 length:366 start_codon:yes stop_codon:yes gene_type:complete